jgi:hypothetical protein
MIHRIKWLLIFMVVGIFLALVLPFPFDLISIVGLFVLMTFLRGRSEKRMFGSTNEIRDLFSSLSSSTSESESNSLKYYCMNCGKEHREIACPKCGSKMKKIG